MRKILFYLSCAVLYLGLCMLSDIVFEDYVSEYTTLVVRIFSFIIALLFIDLCEKKGWNSWSKVIGFFRR